MKVNAEYPKLPEAKKELMVKLKNEMRDLEVVTHFSCLLELFCLLLSYRL